MADVEIEAGVFISIVSFASGWISPTKQQARPNENNDNSNGGGGSNGGE